MARRTRDVRLLPCARGFALVIVLLLTLAAALLVSARYGSERAENAVLRRLGAERLEKEALAYALALLEARLRARFADPAPIAFGEIVAGADGDAVAPALVVETTYPPEGVAAPGRHAGALRVTARALPVAEPAGVRTVARDSECGATARVERRAAYLPECGSGELLEILAPHFAAPEGSESDPEFAHAPLLLASLVDSVRFAASFPMDAGDLNARLGAAIEDAAAAALPGSALLDAEREDLLLALDPRPRLRRTNSHPLRAGGRDRGRVTTAGGVLIGDFSGRFLLEARLQPAPGARAAPARAARTRIDLFERERLGFQDEWLAPGIDRLGGVVLRGAEAAVGVALGPEVEGDGDWTFGAARFVAAPAATTVLGRSWTPLPEGALGVGHGSALFFWRSAGAGAGAGDEWEAREFALGEPLPAHPALPSARAPRAWYVAAANDVLRVADPARAAAGTARGSLPGLERILRLGEEVLAIDAAGAAFLVRDDREEVLAIEPAGSLAAIDAAARRRAVELPLLGALLFPPNEGAESWRVLARDLALVELACSAAPPAAVAPAAGGAAGVFWIAGGGAAARLVHGEVSAGALDALAADAALDFEPQHVIALPGRRRALVVGVDESGEARAAIFRRAAGAVLFAGSAALPAYFGEGFVDARGSMLHLPAPDGFWCVPLDAEAHKRTDLGCEVLRLPAQDLRPAFLRAPLTGDLDARLATGAIVAASGTVNRGASTLIAGDLSDLVADGVYLSPLRNETLRYHRADGAPEEHCGPWSIAEGGGALLVKPERAAADAAEPEEERVVLRAEHEFSVHFQPNAEWIAACHPGAPSASEIVAISVAGAPTRAGTATSMLRRSPAAATWSHRREVVLAGAAWVVNVRAGSPPIDLPPWTIDQALPGFALESTATLADQGAGGAWQSIAWAWNSAGAAFLEVGGESAWDPAPPAPVLPSTGEDGAVWEITTDDWCVEIGGEIGGKAFRGTVSQLRIFEDPLSATETPERIFAAPDAAGAPSLRWVTGRTVPAGSRLRRVRAECELPDGTALSWRVQLLSAALGGAPPPEFASAGSEIYFPPEFALVPADTRIAVELTLRPDAKGLSTPLVDALELEWIAAPRGP